jgi:hypothetical protein
MSSTHTNNGTFGFGWTMLENPTKSAIKELDRTRIKYLSEQLGNIFPTNAIDEISIISSYLDVDELKTTGWELASTVMFQSLFELLTSLRSARIEVIHMGTSNTSNKIEFDLSMESNPLRPSNDKTWNMKSFETKYRSWTWITEKLPWEMRSTANFLSVKLVAQEMWARLERSGVTHMAKVQIKIPKNTPESKVKELLKAAQSFELLFSNGKCTIC